MDRQVLRRLLHVTAVAGMLTGLTATTLLRAAPQAAMESDQLPIEFARTVKPGASSVGASGTGGVLGKSSSGNLIGIDSVVNFTSYFYEPGWGASPYFEPTVFSWPYTMVGRSPYEANDDNREPRGEGRTTWIPAPIVPVNLDLRNADGSPRYVNGRRLFYSIGPYVDPVLKSPIFSGFSFEPGERPTQFTDAVQRAQFHRFSGDSWHTLLKPRVAPARTMVLAQGTYAFALNNDGSCCAYVGVDISAFDDAFYPATTDLSDTKSVVGAAEHFGDIQPADVSTFLFPNTFLYFGDVSNCCLLGFHNYDIEQGDAANGWRERHYVLNFSSWHTPGLFGTFADVSTLSHEIAEIFNDPFVNNGAPWWIDPTGTNCLGVLETGDVIEWMDNAIYPIPMNGTTYHVQSEALLQWFAGETPSSALHGAYSYPDRTLLTSASPSLKPHCAP